MVERSTIVDPFFRALFDELAPKIDDRMVALAKGSAQQIAGSTMTVAELYAEQVATIKAFTAVLEICADIEHNRHGNRPEEQQTQE